MKTGKNLTAKSCHHAGSIVGCIALSAHDIGRAIVGGKSVWFAWGANLDDGEAMSIRETGVDTVKCGKSAFASPVIPLAVMARLSQIIIWDNSRDKSVLTRQLKAQA